MTEIKRPTIPCPTCKKTVEGTQDTWPFCSKRCKLIDLGEWASESYRVPDEKKGEEGSDP